MPHGAREGARVAAVNAGDSGFLLATTCDSMDLTTNITVQFTDGATGAIGDVGTNTVQATPDSLSGLAVMPSLFSSSSDSPPSPLTLHLDSMSVARIRPQRTSR